MAPQPTESYKEAKLFQGGHKGDKGGDDQASTRKFKAKKNGGSSPGEDTGQGGQPNEVFGN